MLLPVLLVTSAVPEKRREGITQCNRCAKTEKFEKRHLFHLKSVYGFFPRFYVDFHWFMLHFQDSNLKKYYLFIPACFFHIFKGTLRVFIRTEAVLKSSVCSLCGW